MTDNATLDDLLECLPEWRRRVVEERTRELIAEHFHAELAATEHLLRSPRNAARLRRSIKQARGDK